MTLSWRCFLSGRAERNILIIVPSCLRGIYRHITWGKVHLLKLRFPLLLRLALGTRYSSPASPVLQYTGMSYHTRQINEVLINWWLVWSCNKSTLPFFWSELLYGDHEKDGQCTVMSLCSWAHSKALCTCLESSWVADPLIVDRADTCLLMVRPGLLQVLILCAFSDSPIQKQVHSDSCEDIDYEVEDSVSKGRYWLLNFSDSWCFNNFLLLRG